MIKGFDDAGIEECDDAGKWDVMIQEDGVVVMLEDWDELMVKDSGVVMLKDKGKMVVRDWGVIMVKG